MKGTVIKNSINSKEEKNMKNTMNNKTTNMSNKTTNNTSKEEKNMTNTIEITTSTSKNEVEYTIEYQTIADACIPVVNGKKMYPLSFQFSSETDKEGGLKTLALALKATKEDIIRTQFYIAIATEAAARKICPDKLLNIGGHDFMVEYATKTLYNLNLTPYVVLEDMKDVMLPPQAIEALLKTRGKNKLMEQGYTIQENEPAIEETNENNINITTEETMDIVEYIKAYQNIASAAKVVYNGDNRKTFLFGFVNEEDKKDNVKIFTSAMKAADNDYSEACDLLITAGMMTAEGIHPDKLIEIRGVKCMIEYKSRTIYAIYARDIKATLDDMEGVELPNEAIEALLIAKMENVLMELEQEAEEDEDEEWTGIWEERNWN